MKIGIVCYPTFGGSGVVATELGIELSKKGHEIHFITYSQPVRLDALSSNLHYHEVNVPDYPLFKYEPYELALSSKLYDVISKYEIDVLHVHYAIPHAYAAYMAKKILNENGYKIPIVTTLHGTDITLVGNHPFYKPAVTFSINKSDIVTCVSKSLMEDTREFFGIQRDIKVIPNFIDIDKYERKHNNCEKNVISEGDEKIIVHISNFRPLKRIIDVIKIFEKINSEKLILAIGIIANTEKLGLKDFNVKIDKGHVVTNEFLETDEKGVYAIGDITDGPWLAHKASHEGILCVEKIAGHQNLKPIDKTSIPGCTYCRPQVASIGMTETQARSKNFNLKINKKDHNTRRGLMKLVGKRKKLLIYVKKKSAENYESIIKSLGLRR